MQTMLNEFLRTLQLFADGETGEVAEATTGETAETAEGAADPQESPEIDLEAEFEEAIKGKYKDLFAKRTQGIIDKRFKETKNLEAQVKSNAEINALLGAKYGIDPSDIAALAQAVNDDDSYIEEAAYENNMTVEQYRTYLEGEKAKQELEEMKRQERREQLTTFFNTQAENVKTKFNDNDFDFWDEYNNNRQFQTMINSGVDVETAYKVLNMEKITATVAEDATKKAKQAIANDIRANGVRPTEGGIKSNQAPINSSLNIRGLTDKQMEDYIEQARHGKVITFR